MPVVVELILPVFLVHVSAHALLQGVVRVIGMLAQLWKDSDVKDQHLQRGHVHFLLLLPVRSEPVNHHKCGQTAGSSFMDG